MKHTLFIIVGVSGSGKTTFGDVLRSFGVRELISHTTRPIRTGEEDGVHYHFCNQEQFDAVEMVESNTYPSSGSMYSYGTSKKEIDGKLRESHAYAVLDRVGALNLRRLYPGQTRIIYMDISEEEMVKRLRGRGETEDNIASRLVYARENGEFNHILEFDHVVQANTKEDLLPVAWRLLTDEQLV